MGSEMCIRDRHICSVRYADVPKYELVSQQGPAHERIFVVQAVVHGKECGLGRGKSKKEAEQSAAKEAISLMGYETN